MYIQVGKYRQTDERNCSSVSFFLRVFNMKLLVGPSGLAVIPITLERITLISGKTIPAGDISLEELSTLMNDIVDEQPVGGKKH